MKLSTTKVVHPLTVVRVLLRKSRAEFGNLFEISGRYVEKIEYGKRPLTDEWADRIALRYGIDPESLKRKKGFPRAVIDLKGINFSYRNPDVIERIEKAQTQKKKGFPTEEELEKEIEEMLLPVEELNALQKVPDKYERLQLWMRFWQRYVIIDEDWNRRQAQAVLHRKLDLLLEAAREKSKFIPVAVRLSRGIDDVVSGFLLRNKIDELRAKRTGDDAEWPSFIESLKVLRVNPPRQRSRRKR